MYPWLRQAGYRSNLILYGLENSLGHFTPSVKFERKRMGLERALHSLDGILQPLLDKPIDLLWSFPQSPMPGLDRPPGQLGNELLHTCRHGRRKCFVFGCLDKEHRDVNRILLQPGQQVSELRQHSWMLVTYCSSSLKFCSLVRYQFTIVCSAHPCSMSGG